MLDAQSFSQALNLAYFYLKFRPRTEKEIIRYLERKKNNFSPEIIKKVITQLQEQGYVDDIKFIQLFVSHRNKLKPKSSFVLTQELQKLGIERNLIHIFFQNNPSDEVQLAQTALQNKTHVFSRLDAKTRYQKAISFLLRRGFSYDIAKKAFQFVFNSQNTIEE